MVSMLLIDLDVRDDSTLLFRLRGGARGVVASVSTALHKHNRSPVHITD